MPGFASTPLLLGQGPIKSSLIGQRSSALVGVRGDVVRVRPAVMLPPTNLVSHQGGLGNELR